jgi:hypothetical protein
LLSVFTVIGMPELSDSETAIISAFRHAVQHFQREQTISSPELPQGAISEQVGTVIRVAGEGVYEIQAPSKERTVVHSDSLIDLVSMAVSSALIPGSATLSIFERALLLVIQRLVPMPEAGVQIHPAENAAPARPLARVGDSHHAIEVDPITSRILSLLSEMDKANLVPTVSGEDTVHELHSIREAARKRISEARQRISQS